METLDWSDQQGSRDRRAFLILVKNGVVTRFVGDTIPDLVVVVSKDFSKQGKWSHNTFRLALHPGVKAIHGHNGWENNTFCEGLRKATQACVDTWVDVAAALGVGVPEAMRFLRDFKPVEAETLDARDVALDSLQDEVENTSRVEVRFGSPIRRYLAAGFWGDPKDIPGVEGGEVFLITPPEEMPTSNSPWVNGNVGVRGVKGVVLDVVQASGMKGGYVTVILQISV